MRNYNAILFTWTTTIQQQDIQGEQQPTNWSVETIGGLAWEKQSHDTWTIAIPVQGLNQYNINLMVNWNLCKYLSPDGAL